MFSDYVAENMELTEEDKEFVNQVFDRIVNAAKKTQRTIAGGKKSSVH